MYIDILLHWNARINLTAIRDPEQIVTRHFGESLFAARHLFPRVGTAALGCPGERTSPSVTPAGIGSDSAAERRQNAAHGASRGSDPARAQAPEGRKIASSTGTDQDLAHRESLQRNKTSQANDRLEPALSKAKGPTTNDRIAVADVGSGAGFPGIPIKLWAPQISLTLIESSHKKAAFLREVARALTLTDINILTTRAEHIRQSFDLVTLRAVEHFPEILPAAAALVSPAGRLALLIGSSQQDQAQATLPTFHWPTPTPTPQSTSRILLIGNHEPKK
jgi:16S rRNA G527 N7-methylase RsmG